MKFDENLRNLRREKDYSQEYLAGVMDVSRQTISKWENGTAMPDLKKLTQLAELFEVSMDTLLGIEYSSKEDNGSYNADAQNENNFDSIAALIEADHKAILTSTKKILAVTLSVIIIVAVIISSLVVSDLKDNINFTKNQVQSLFENQQYYYDSGSSNDEEIYTECEVIGIDAQKPYIVNASFTYEPTTYAKGTSVYFLVPQRDGSFKHIDADPDKAEQGVFTAECQLDVTLDRCFYTIIDDGESITKEEVDSDILSIYPELEYFSGDGTCVMSMDGLPSPITISSETIPSIYLNYGGNIKSARQIVKLNGKELHNSEIKMSKSQTDEMAFDLGINKEIEFEVPADTNNIEMNKLEFYYEFEMDMGYTVRYYPFLWDFTDNTYIFDFEEGFDHYEYIFNIDGEKVTVR